MSGLRALSKGGPIRPRVLLGIAFNRIGRPNLALSRHMHFTDLSEDEFVKVAASHVQALNHALFDVPEEKVRIHICRVNYEGPYVCDIDMAKMFDTLVSAKAQYLLFETSNLRHGHEWTVFRDRKSDIPDDKSLFRGRRYHHEFRRAS